MERVVVKSNLRVASNTQARADLAYWRAQPAQARIDALEALRRQHFDRHPDADARLQRVCRVAQRTSG